MPYDPVVVALTDAQTNNIIGKYTQINGGVWEIKQRDGKLYFIVTGPQMEMIPHAAHEFGLRKTAGILQFTFDDLGKPKELKFTMGGSEMRAVPTAK